MHAGRKTIRVWDPLVRIGHWLLVLGFFTAYVTEDEFLTQHVWAGYIVGAVVCIRLVWGFIGTRYARFTDFVRSPAATISYLRSLLTGQAPQHIGHNPAGGAMIIALLASLTVTVYTGLMLYAVEENAGPLAGLVTERSSAAPPVPGIATAKADDDEHDEDSGRENDSREEFWEELHEFFANFTLLLVAIHIAGVLFSSYIHRENLIKAMITGRKQVRYEKRTP